MFTNADLSSSGEQNSLMKHFEIEILWFAKWFYKIPSGTLKPKPFVGRHINLMQVIILQNILLRLGVIPSEPTGQSKEILFK
jgi:hypothetical protein